MVIAKLELRLGLILVKRYLVRAKFFPLKNHALRSY